MCLLVITLTLCLVSIWLDGSPFQADYFFANSTNSLDCDITPSVASCLSSNSSNNGGDFYEDSSYSPNFVSVAVLMIGMITARYGLYNCYILYYIYLYYYINIYITLYNEICM